VSIRVSRFEAGVRASAIRGVDRGRADISAAVREILEQVQADGDAAVRALTARFDGVDRAGDVLRVSAAELDSSIAAIEPALLDALQVVTANVRAVAEAQLGSRVSLELAQGQRVELAELPVRRAAVYAPGGRAPYPSTVVMCAATAQVAGVEELAVCTPPAADGRVHPATLAACSLCGVSEVYRVGGAQAIAALALGTESIPPVDLIVGPGNRYVQEAKRQLVGTVGIDGIAGPSEVAIVLARGADPRLAALDLLAQGEHGPDGLLVVLSADAELLRDVERSVEELSFELEVSIDAALAVVHARDTAAAVALADALAPEHLQLVGEEAEALASTVRAAGCLFVGRDAGTAFGDYVAGSNHVLPTGGTARFQGSLSVATFRRLMARVSLPAGAAGRLAGPGSVLARAEGFPAHASSMERRA